MRELENRGNYQEAREGGRGTGKKGGRDRLKEKVKTQRTLRVLTYI